MSFLKELVNRFWNYLLAFFCAIVIYILSTSESIQLPAESIISPDKVGHFIAYSVLSFLIFVGLSKEGSISKFKILFVILLCTLYGVFLEFLQYTFFPNRFFDLWDAAANFIGSVIGFLTFRQLFQNLNN